MTPEMLNEIEARAKETLTTFATRQRGREHSTDVLALVAAYRELEKQATYWEGTARYRDDAYAALRVDAEKAEARVKELESETGHLKVELRLRRWADGVPDALTEMQAKIEELETENSILIADIENLNIVNKGSVAATARVAVLREALDNAKAKLAPDNRGRHSRDCISKALGFLVELDIDPAATALTERLKAAEEVCEEAARNLPGGPPHHLWQGEQHDLHDALAAWRKVKGNHG